MSAKTFPIVIITLGMLVASGCALPAYQRGGVAPAVPELIATPEMVERGKPNCLVDGIGWTLGIPSKLILWDRRVDNHHVSAATEGAAVAYLAENEMADVVIRSNQYAPLREFKRLYHNRRVGCGWRATLGVASVLGYTLLPGRIFGGDAYNPFTHSIYLYSDVPAIALHEAGHAKDFARRRWPGTYAAVSLLPLTSLYVEAVATHDVFGYLEQEEDPEQLAAAYEILYPAYGTYVGSEIGGLIWPEGGILLSIGGAIPGHLWGRIKARQQRNSMRNQTACEKPLASPETNRATDARPSSQSGS